MKNTSPPFPASTSNEGGAISRRSAVIGLGLTTFAALSYLNMPRAIASSISKQKFQQMIPDTVGRWSSRRTAELVLPAIDEQEEKLYENLETRIYEGDGLPSMMVLIAYSSVQMNDVQVHRPEVCYPAAGFPILWTKTVSIDVGPQTVHGRELVADRGGLNERIIYWVRVGNTFPIGWAEQRLKMAESNARGIIPDGLLFRVSTFENEPGFSSKAIEIFIKTFVAASGTTFSQSVLF